MIVLPGQQSPKDVSEKQICNVSSFPELESLSGTSELDSLSEEDSERDPASSPVRWTFQKPMSRERFFRYLQPSLTKGHLTNGGPLQAVLQDKLLDFVGLSKPAGREAVLACNGTAALHGLVVGLSLQKKRSLTWVTQAFAFPSSCQGPLENARIVDIDEKLKGPALQVLEETKNSFDGVIVTNMFGLQVEGILLYEEWCQKNGKLLIVDNAATPIGKLEDGRNIHQVGDGSMVSLHETKAIGRGEGGVIFVDHALAPFVHQAINFGYKTSDKIRKHHASGFNGKMSDIAAAAICDHLDYVNENHWKETFEEKIHRAVELLDEASLKLALPVRSPTILSCLFLDLGVPCAEAVSQKLADCGVEAKRYYTPMLPREEAPEAWKWFDHTICLPFHMATNEDQLKFQLNVISDVLDTELARKPVDPVLTDGSQSFLQQQNFVSDLVPTVDRIQGPVEAVFNESSSIEKLTQDAGKVFVVGAGGLGRSIQAWFPDQVNAFIDDHCKQETVNNVPVLGGIQWLTEQVRTNCDQEIAVVIGIGDNASTEKIVSTLRTSSNRFVFPTLVHSSAFVAPTADIQEGVIFMPQSMVAPNCSVGRFTLLNTGACVSHDAVVGDYCRIHGGARVLGGCHIGNHVMLGTNSVVNPCVKAADSCKVGCGSALVKDASVPGTVLGGVPAKAVRQGCGNLSADKSLSQSALAHPLHGQVIEDTLSSSTLAMIEEGLKQESNGIPGYYTQSIYDPLIYMNNEELKSYVSKHVPGYRVVSDLLLTQQGSDSGFAWHCDYLGNFYLEDPTDMVCLWIPLMDTSEETGGRLLHTTSAESHLLGRLETYSRLYHEHTATGVLHPFGAKVLPLLNKQQKVQNVKKGQALVFSNHTWHRAEPLKKDDLFRPVYVMRLIPVGSRFSTHRCNISVFIQNNYPGPVARLLKTEPPELFADDEEGYSQQNGMEGFKDFMSHYNFQESSVVRLLVDATESMKRLSSSCQTLSLPPCLDESYAPTSPHCLVTFADSLKESVPTGSRLQDFHKFVTQLAGVKALNGSSTDEELDRLLEGTFAKDAESRTRACEMYEFLRKRPEWSLQLRLTVLSGPQGFFHPPGWTVETLDHYLANTESLDQEMVRAWEEQCATILAQAKMISAP